MNIAESFANACQWIAANREIIDVVLTVLLTLASAVAVKERMSAREALVLIANTLKDEGKMEGGRFAAETGAKLEKIAEVIGAGQTAVAEAKRVLTETNTAPAGDIKIASVNGKPIYLGQALGVGSALRAALGVIRGIIRR